MVDAALGAKTMETSIAALRCLTVVSVRWMLLKHARCLWLMHLTAHDLDPCLVVLVVVGFGTKRPPCGRFSGEGLALPHCCFSLGLALYFGLFGIVIYDKLHR